MLKQHFFITSRGSCQHDNIRNALKPSELTHTVEMKRIKIIQWLPGKKRFHSLKAKNNSKKHIAENYSLKIVSKQERELNYVVS